MFSSDDIVVPQYTFVQCSAPLLKSPLRIRFLPPISISSITSFTSPTLAMVLSGEEVVGSTVIEGVPLRAMLVWILAGVIAAVAILDVEIEPSMTVFATSADDALAAFSVFPSFPSRASFIPTTCSIMVEG